MDGDQLQALPLTDGLDPLSLLCGTQALLPAPRLSDDPDGSDAAAPYRTAWIGGNRATRRQSPDDLNGEDR